MTAQVFTIANQLTLLRMLLIPLFVILTLYGEFGWSLAVFAFAGLTDLLDGLDPRGCLVSLDALACRPEIAEQITARGGDYLLALKSNQKKAHAAVKDWFAANAFARGAAMRPCCDGFDESHGRLVRRRVFAGTALEPFAALRPWPGLATVLAVETIRSLNGSGKVTAEIRYYLSSSKLPPERLAVAIRGHWSIENGLHWVLDVGFKAMATDAGPALVAGGAAADAAYQFMGDEHGGLRFSPGTPRPSVGDLVTLVAPHCDPTVNLHNWFHVMQNGRLVDIWPIDARGY